MLTWQIFEFLQDFSCHRKAQQSKPVAMASGHSHGLRNSQLEMLTKGFYPVASVILVSERRGLHTSSQTPWTTIQKKYENCMLLRESDANWKGWIPMKGHLERECDYESNKNMSKMISNIKYMLVVSMLILTREEKFLKNVFPLFAVAVLPLWIIMLRIKGISIYCCYRH